MDNLNNLFIPVRERIFTLLASKSISQRDFAQMIDVIPQTITDWKKGKSFSFMKKLNPIADALNTTEVWLLTGIETINPETVREMETIADAWSVHLLDLFGAGGKLDQYRIEVTNIRRKDGGEVTPEEEQELRRLLASGPRRVYDEVDAGSKTEFLRVLPEGGALGQTGKKMTTPGEGSGLSAEQLELVRLFEAAPQALRAAALAVLKSAEEQGKAPGGDSKAE